MKTLTPRLAPTRLVSVAPAPKVADPFYSTCEWRALLEELIRVRGRCCQDPAHDRSTPRCGIRVVGDHIVERKDGGADLDPTNVLLRCWPCHTRKTAAARAARKG